MTRVRAVTACLITCVLAAVLAAVAWADGSSVAEGQSDADSLWHIDVGVSFTGSGSGESSGNVGAGTVRVTLPGVDPAYPPAFDAANPVEPAGYSCRVVNGAYGQPGTGFECSSDGTATGGGLQFPADVTLHLVSSSCYSFPPDGSPQPAIADVWAAPGQTGGAPDRSFNLSFQSPCPTAPPDDEGAVLEPTPRCVVPKLTGATLAAAKAKLRRASCGLGKVKRVTSAKVGKGRVVSQSRRRGRRLPNGARVNVAVSKGARR